MEEIGPYIGERGVKVIHPARKLLPQGLPVAPLTKQDRAFKGARDPPAPGSIIIAQ